MQNRNNSPKSPVLTINTISVEDLILIEQGKMPDPFYTHGKRTPSPKKNNSFFASPLNKIPEVKEEVESLTFERFMRRS